MFVKEQVIIPIVIFGMIFHKREPYAKAICVFCVIIIFNTFLKSVFKVPLLPHLGEGYSFPSGHMHAAAIFYGYLLCKFDDWKIKIFLASLIGGIGFSIIRCKYHTPFDVTGALAFASAELFVYRHLEKNVSPKFLAIFALAFSIVIMKALFLMQQMQSHVWLGFYILTGMIIGTWFFGEYSFKSLHQKIAALIFSLISVCAIYYFGSFLKIENLYGYVVSLKFLILPIAIFASIFVASKISFSRKMA